MVNPAAFASLTLSGLAYLGVLKPVTNFLTGFLHNGHWVKGGLLIGLLRSNPFLHEGHPSSGASAMYE